MSPAKPPDPSPAPADDPPRTDPYEATFVLCVLLVFAIICLIVGWLGSMPGQALVGFVGVAGFYLLMVKSGWMNPIEWAVICLPLLMMALFLPKAIERVSEAAKRHREKESTGQLAPPSPRPPAV